MTPRRRAVRPDAESRPADGPEGTGARVIPLRAAPEGTGPDDGAPEDGAVPAADEPAAPAHWEEALAEAMAFLRRRLEGDYAVDEFGFDAELTDNVIIPALRPLYRNWFRVETIGMDHVPDVGGALVVANHSGTLPLDSLMAAVALHDDHPARRHLRMLGADLMFRLPVVGPLARKQGSTLACTPDAQRLMASGELVGVWPEGFKGIGKPFRDRYKLQRFGRGGFVSAALRTGVPIIPCSIVGAEEIYPKIGDIKPLARLFGAPYFPVTPLFPAFGPVGLVPLPSKWYIEFGEPIRTDSIDPAEADDPMTVFNLTDQVRETIQHTLYRLLSQRRSTFLG
ncbi:lysophospholipid acyltransferase family protein [Pseudonocardia sichuanensis]